MITKHLHFLKGILTLLLFITVFSGRAQEMPQIPALPVDTGVVTGTLPNGLTYYIRHNNNPKGQADFYIAQRVGSMLEEDNQRGLAHFLEHMCFNGTTHFPGNSLIKWLESVGVKFGYNLNAYTSMDETVYNISNVPVARESVQDSCLLILHDWANDLLLEDAEIDAERAVIHEEWRQSNVGQMRILEALLPTIYPGSRYGYRLPIGTMEVVDNFPYQALRDYYERWYRPDQQAVIVVGDIDPARIEAKIKEMFADIEMPADAPERIYFEVEDTPGTIYAIGHDKEQPVTVAQLMFKSDRMPAAMRLSQMSYAQSYMENMIATMLNDRLNDISSKPDAPFGQASLDFGEFLVAKTKDAMTLAALAKDPADPVTPLAAAYRELLRASRGGFTQGEYERAKATFLSNIEQSYNNRNSRQNEEFVNKYVRHFIDSLAIPDIETEYQVMKMCADMIPLAVINQTMSMIVTPDNRVLLALLPDNAAGVYPEPSQFAEALAAVDAETIEPLVDTMREDPLVTSLAAPGKIVSETTDAALGTTTWQLSNGAKVVIKTTDFKDDEIQFEADAPFGLSNFIESSSDVVAVLPLYLRAMGLGAYSNSDLIKYLAGKQADINLGPNMYYTSLEGSTNVKDLPVLMELIYMTMTAVNFTPEEFDATRATYTSVLHNQENNPQYIFQKSVYEALYNSPDLIKVPSSAILGKVDREAVINLARSLTANAAIYTFTFVGNVDKEALRPLVEKYIASLPSSDQKLRNVIPSGILMKSGDEVSTFTTPMETPQTFVYFLEWGSEEAFPFTTLNSQLASIAGQILSTRLLDIVREKEGAVYSISASGRLSRINPQPLTIESGFPMKPEMKDKVLSILKEQMNLLATNVSPEELAKVKEFMVKNYHETFETNNGWITLLSGIALKNVNTYSDYLATLDSITPEMVAAYVRKLVDLNNCRIIVLDPDN
ncbi:MAG: insulinase family protein [Paramuribaculum sp.]|nr:insulinase family protein [Paramuribaculum sp.]